MTTRHLKREQGVSLAITLSMLLLVMMLGIAAAQIALQGEKLARNERDRQLAFQAAEAALLDAEMDIAQASAGSNPAGRFFAADSKRGFPKHGAEPCASGARNIHLGMCRLVTAGVSPAWKNIDFLEDSAGTTQTVPYSHFTGRAYPHDAASVSARLPRYAIELMADPSMSALTGKPCYFYRVTAIGFGTRTQVVLQSVYRKALSAGASGGQSGGRLSWREIVNWSELNMTGSYRQEQP
ncbi:hypothetical protein D3C72_151790 [compost metagenome]